MHFPFVMRPKLGKPATPELPILIPLFNNPSYCRMMVDQLLARGLSRITLIDNASTSAEMGQLLDAMEQKVRVIRLKRNMGPKYFARNWLFYLRLPPIFCVTDPDIQFNPRLPADFLTTLLALTEEHQIGKCGFALNIQDHHEFRDIRLHFKGQDYDIVSWESQFWQQQIGATSAGDPVFRADIDTTFALYNKKFFRRAKLGFYRALRVGGDFTARHLPWYRESGIGPAEARTYAQSQKFSWYSRS
ncbi:MAG: glycosyltransferase [Roseomonas sp.]|nr:glycosyltransferase [Roseomonas sp.]MCA3382269.1 glycosyltransferase [Roseomonas sp.]